jgi:7-cyano-7-deazaguanine reductase
MPFIYGPAVACTRAVQCYVELLSYKLCIENIEEESAPMSDQENPRTPGKYGQEEIARNQLEPWPNAYPGRDYVVHFEIPEFTCLCPRSGYPDFATMVIDYVPGESIVELKSLKLYINGFRDRGVSHEAVTNEILDDLVRTLAPRWIRVVGEFNVRGNIKTTVFAEEAQPKYTGPRPEYRRPTFTGI